MCNNVNINALQLISRVNSLLVRLELTVNTGQLGCMCVSPQVAGITVALR